MDIIIQIELSLILLENNRDMIISNTTQGSQNCASRVGNAPEMRGMRHRNASPTLSYVATLLVFVDSSSNGTVTISGTSAAAPSLSLCATASSSMSLGVTFTTMSSRSDSACEDGNKHINTRLFAVGTVNNIEWVDTGKKNRRRKTIIRDNGYCIQ